MFSQFISQYENNHPEISEKIIRKQVVKKQDRAYIANSVLGLAISRGFDVTGGR